MSYAIIFDPAALRELKRLPKTQQRRIAPRIGELADDPRPASAAKMAGLDAYRIRVGAARVIYAVRDDVLIVLIVRVGDRRDVYQDLDAVSKRLRRQRGGDTSHA